MEIYTLGGNPYLLYLLIRNPDHGKLGHSFKAEDNKVSKGHYNTKNSLSKGGLPAKVNFDKKIK
jgi:hypothetical protein